MNRTYRCSKYRVSMIFRILAVRCTLLTIYVVDLYIMTLFIEAAVFQWNT